MISIEGRWLVIERSEQVRAPGCFCFPGGGIEPGESEEQALVRELQEELNVDSRPVRRLWRSRTSWNVELAWWHAQLLTPPEQIIANPREVASFHWVEPNQIARLPKLLSSNHEFLAARARGEIQFDAP